MIRQSSFNIIYILLIGVFVFSACSRPSNNENVSYYSDGGKQWYVPYEEGRPHGVALFYYRSGRVKLQLVYDQGELILLKRFDRTGRLMQQYDFREMSVRPVN